MEAKVRNLFKHQRSIEESAMKARERQIAIGRSHYRGEVRNLLNLYKEKGFDPTEDVEQFIKFVDFEISKSQEEKSTI